MCANMAATRPTAPDLFRCIDAMKREVTNHQGSHPALIERLTTRADELQQARTALDLRLADEGAAFIKDKMRVLVQGNTGALATGGFGMSFGAVKRAKADGALPLLRTFCSAKLEELCLRPRADRPRPAVRAQGSSCRW